ncbi:hypothetical protein ZIOFF_028215 [Zingiber officinale]|uniref:Uncharacterized protein n=1 Tax=Zingiber officinale TaxID=94328 RepID=A0A8J5L9Q6_ZINOF|nr:hypothetical protein ZIOFF_028215 [Zingiber officinale]
MMHEFRLPATSSLVSLHHHHSATSLFKVSCTSLDHKNHILPNDSLAICRIFKKTNSMAQRAVSHSNWVSSEAMTTTPPDFHRLLPLPNSTHGHHHAVVPFVSDHIMTQPPTPSHLISCTNARFSSQSAGMLIGQQDRSAFLLIGQQTDQQEAICVRWSWVLLLERRNARA